MTLFQIVNVEQNQTSVEIELKTGRLHQIRRHFHKIGFPVMGDPRYGMNNKNDSGLKLCAAKLSFTNLKKKIVEVSSPITLF